MGILTVIQGESGRWRRRSQPASGRSIPLRPDRATAPFLPLRGTGNDTMRHPFPSRHELRHDWDSIPTVVSMSYMG